MQRAAANESMVREQIGLIDDIVRSRAISRIGEGESLTKTRKKTH